VDNDAKGCLDDIALNLQRSTDATLVVVGNSAPVTPPKGRRRAPAMTADQMAAQRAVNEKAYLVTEKGIDASRISVRTDGTGNNECQNYLVPAGANFDNDVQGTTAVDENTVKPVARTAPPARHHHKAAAPAPQQ
jgi:hypothetical protein